MKIWQKWIWPYCKIYKFSSLSHNPYMNAFACVCLCVRLVVICMHDVDSACDCVCVRIGSCRRWFIYVTTVWSGGILGVWTPRNHSHTHVVVVFISYGFFLHFPEPHREPLTHFHDSHFLAVLLPTVDRTRTNKRNVSLSIKVEN